MKHFTSAARATARERLLVAERPLALVALVLLAAAWSCGESSAMGVASELKSPPPMLLNLDRVKALDRRRLARGDRTTVLADSTAKSVVSEASLVVRDTNVVSLDGAGLLYAVGLGRSWIVWPLRQANDSVLVTVAALDATEERQGGWTRPRPPTATVDVRFPTGGIRGERVAKSFRVTKGGNLQAALDAAQPGDEVVLASGVTFTGNYVLPKKQTGDNRWIIVRADVTHVAGGTRTSPMLAADAPTIVTPNQAPAISAAPGAHRWRLVGLQVAHAKGAAYNYGIVVLGQGDERTVALQPSDIVLDRMYIHGSPTDGTSRCVSLQGRSMAVIDSWLSECHAKGFDAQGVGGWSGGGPFLIENNHIEASGQAIMFGGADPPIRNVTPSDIIIRHNHLYKPLAWANGRWTVKAVFELKHARRVVFEGNVLENHWIDAQVGYAILFQALSQDNLAPWSTVQDVLVQNNLIKNSTSGVNILARFNNVIVTPTSRIAVINNFFQDVGGDPISGAPGRIFQILSAVEDVTLANNSVTLDGAATTAVLFDGEATVRTTIMNNVFPTTEYGIGGSGTGTGTAALEHFAPGGTATRNVLPAQSERLYPAGNFFPATGQAAGKSALGTADICTRARTWLSGQNISDSIGVNCRALEQAIRTTVTAPPP